MRITRIWLNHLYYQIDCINMYQHIFCMLISVRIIYDNIAYHSERCKTETYLSFVLKLILYIMYLYIYIYQRVLDDSSELMSLQASQIVAMHTYWHLRLRPGTADCLAEDWNEEEEIRKFIALKGLAPSKAQLKKMKKTQMRDATWPATSHVGSLHSSNYFLIFNKPWPQSCCVQSYSSYAKWIPEKQGQSQNMFRSHWFECAFLDFRICEVARKIQ